jgi:CHAT domain
VRIVQDRLLNQSRQVHLAEVFLGGLLKPLTAIAPDTNPDRVQYGFFEGVREVLLVSLPLPDSVDVLDAVSKFVASRMGLSLEAFAAVLRNPQQGQVGELAEQMQPFARVTAQVLKRMGGEYAKFAVELEGAFQENDRVLEAELELEAALAIAGEQERAIALTDLMARSSESPSVLLRSLSAIESEVDRISALIALIPYLPNILLSDALGIIRAIQNTSSRFQGLATIAALLPEVVPEALQAALDIEDESTRLKALTTVVEKMPAALLPQALEAARTIEDDYSRARVLIALAAKLPELIPSALDTIQAIRNNYLRAQALTALADLSPELLSHLPELRQKVNSLIEASSRILLRQARSTQVYVCCTANPWHLLFDALVIPVGHQGGLGNLGVAFQAYFSASADSGWLSQAIRNTMRTSRINRIRPDQPLFVKLPANVDIDTRLSSLEDFRSERVIICATSESEDETSSRNTSVAYEAVIRLIVNRRFRHVVLPLIGTGVNQLQVSDVVTGMIRAIDQILKSPEPLALKEIAIVDRDEDKIEAITGIFHRFDDLKTILFLAADPRNCRWVHLDQQIKEIKQRLNRRQKRDRFQFHLDHKWDVTDRDLQRLMLDFKPQIVHFLGHSVGQAGLALEDANGQVQLVGSESLAKLFKLFADREVGCVVLNACYSETQATAIAQHIPYVIGMDQAIGDRAAIEFTVGFYDALGAGRSIEFAYELACSAIQLAGLPEHLTPVLIKKSNLA